MSGEILLDTNIVIAFLEGDSSITHQPEPSDRLYISSTVVGESCFGAYKSAQFVQNVDRINEFISDVESIPCDNDTAHIYGQIKTSLRQRGRPIPDNDIWIAATARQYSLSLATRDDHFRNVEHLEVIRG